MAVRTWKLSGNGSGDFFNAANWVEGAVPGAADGAYFNTDITQNSTITFNSSTSVGGLYFSDFNASGFTWTMSGSGTYTGPTSGLVETLTDATIAVPFAGSAGWDKIGAATLTLSGGGSNSATWAVKAGTLIVTGGDFIPGIAANGGLRVYSGATVTLQSSWTKWNNQIAGGGTLNISPASGKTVRFSTFYVGFDAASSPISSGNGIATINGPGTFVFETGANTPGVRIGYTNCYGAVRHTGGVFDIANNSSTENVILGYSQPASYVGTGGSITHSTTATSTWNSSFRLGPLTASSTTAPAVAIFNGTTVNMSGAAFGQAPLAGQFASNLVSFRQGSHSIGTYGLSDSTAVNADNSAGFKLAVEGNGTPSSTTVTIGTLNATATTYTTNYSHIALTRGGRLSATTYNFSGTVPRYFSMVDGGELVLPNGLTWADDITFFGSTRNKLEVTSGTATVSAILSSATGSGVSTVTVTGESGFVGPPHLTVALPGSGIPAMVRANYNSATDITVDVIVPGTGYAAAPALTALGGGWTASATYTAAAPTANTAGGLEKTGAGTLILTANNTYTGGTTVTGGTLNVGNSGTAGLAGALTGAVSIGAGTTLEWARSDALTLSGIVSGAATGTLSRIGSAAGSLLTLSGSNTAFDSAISIATNNGIAASNASALGGTTAGTYGSITINSGGVLQLNGASTYKDISVSGTGISGGGAITSPSGSPILYGNITFGSNVSITSGNTLELRGTISDGGGGYSLTKAGASFLRLYSLTNTFSGDVVINASTLGAPLWRNAGVVCSLGTGSGIQFANGATLTGALASNTYYSGATNRTVTLTGTATGGTVTISKPSSPTYNYTGSFGFNGSFVGSGAASITKTLALTATASPANCIATSLTNGLAGSGASTFAVSKAGSGSVTLSGVNNSYSGGTTITAGMLVAAAEDGSRRFGDGPVTLSGTARIQALTGITQKGRHTYPNNLTFGANTGVRIGGGVGGFAALATLAAAQPIRLGGTLTLPGSGTTTWDLSTDPVFQRNATSGQAVVHTLIEFDPGVATPVSGDLATAVTVVPPTGWTAGTPTLVAEDTVNFSPAKIILTLTKT